MSPPDNVALELALMLLERLRADGTMPQDEIDKTLSRLIHKHDIATRVKHSGAWTQAASAWVSLLGQ